MNLEKTKKNKLVRVNMNLSQNIVDKVKEIAEESGLNITSTYTMLINQAIEYKSLMKQLPVLISLFDNFKSELNDKDSELNDKDVDENK